jgi:hypothetical protein
VKNKAMALLCATAAAALIGMGSASADEVSVQGWQFHGPFSTEASCTSHRYWMNGEGYQTWPCFMEDDYQWWHRSYKFG